MGRPLEEPGHHQGTGPWVGKSCSLAQLMGSWVFLPASDKLHWPRRPVELCLPWEGRVSLGTSGAQGACCLQAPFILGWRRDRRASGVLSPSSAVQPPQKGLTLVPAAGRSATSFPPWFSAGWASAQNIRKQLSTIVCFMGRIYPSQGAEVRFHPLRIKPISVISPGARLALWTHWTRGGMARGPNCFIPRTLQAPL